jgi:hypothetical protein
MKATGSTRSASRRSSRSAAPTTSPIRTPSWIRAAIEQEAQLALERRLVVAERAPRRALRIEQHQRADDRQADHEEGDATVAEPAGELRDAHR